MSFSRYCVCCGKGFTPPIISKGDGIRRYSGRRTCSNECSYRMRRRVSLETPEPREPFFVEIKRQCLVCGSEFAFQQDVNRYLSQRRTCSDACAMRLKVANQQASAAKAKAPPAGSIEREQQIAAAVRNPQIEQLRQQLAFYEKRGISGQVRLLAQKIQELGGTL